MARSFSSPASGREPPAPQPYDRGGRVAVRCFPDSDGQFCAFVQELVSDSWELARGSEALIAVVHDKLAAQYPLATIHPRDELAELGPHERQTWYVYRDGRAA